MKITIFTIVLALAPLFLWAQQSEKVTLNWMDDGVEIMSDGRTITYPVFEGSVTSRSFATLPAFMMVHNVLSWQEADIKIIPVETDTLLCNGISRYADEDLLTTDWQLKTDYRTGQAVTYLLPLKKVGVMIIRLKQFEVVTQIITTDNSRSSLAFAPHYSNESVLNTGEWYKIGITKTGMYKLDYTDLLDMGIEVSKVDPENIKIFGQYNGMLPEANSKPRADDLLENAIEVVGQEDGSFDEGDYILFAGQGPVIWKYNPFNGRYEHTNNLYSDTVFYFLTIGDEPGKRIEVIEPPADPPSETITTFTDYAVVDNDLENIGLSGKLWLGERFEGETNSRHFNFDFPNRILNDQVYMRMRVAARGIDYTYFRAKVNDVEVIDSSLINYIGPNSVFHAKEITRSKSFIDKNSETLDVEIIRETNDVSGIGWVDNILLNVQCQLKWRNGQMGFSNPESMDSHKVSKFVLSQAPANVKIWDVTDVLSPKIELLEFVGSDASFISRGEKNQHFIAFSEAGLYKPVVVRKVPNQNLHGIGAIDMVIVTPEIFVPQANELAGLHRDIDGLTTVVVTTGQVYNEFSSGMQDVSAIRDFVRMLHNKGNFRGKPGYLLFFGDASFDYKDRVRDNNNMVPTFESVESLKNTLSFATDDFFGLLDDNEGLDAIGDLDVSIGRLPVSTIEQANTAVKKIKVYTEKSERAMGDWRNSICFIADDQDMNLHLHQAKTLVSIVDTVCPELNINKIFADAYYREKFSGGFRYPEVNKAINEQVQSGALIINYTGHGGLTGWAEELILDMPAIRGFSNIDNLPLFITATCEFSRFDDPLFQSAGEMVFLNENGGGIALMTTTRLAYAHANIALNSKIYLNLKNSEGNEPPRMGDLIRMSKVPSNSNFLNFVLLGDPALSLAFPKYKVATTSILNTTGKATDTVRAMSVIKVKGEIRYKENVVEDFNGYLYPKVFDKESVYTTRANAPKSFKEEFTLMDKLLYSGKVTVSNGHFEFSFVVPGEIAMHYGYGKLSYFAVDTVTYADATGYYNEIVVGGTDPDAEHDIDGPSISMYMNHKSFVNGDIINRNSILYASITDKGGINFTGMNIGRDILLILDDDYAGAEVINNMFEPDVDSYTSGKIQIPFNDLQDGFHTITLRAWDLQGNLGEQQLSFLVKSDASIGLNNVMVYPNPFYDRTTFRFSNDKGGGDLSIEINIFDITGKLIGNMTEKITGAGKIVEVPFNWQTAVNGSNDPQSGVFVYEMIVSDRKGFTEIVRQKIIKLAD